MYIIDKWGKKRPAELITCKQCGRKSIKRIYLNRKNIYCSPECSRIAKKKRVKVICDYCGKVFSKRPSSIRERNFCRREHLDLWQKGKNHPNWKDGKASYHTRAIRKYGYNCSNGENCPLKEIKLPSFMYEVDHIDKNRNNNKIENLRVYCVWCHRKNHLP